jgi:hypothetical protein
MSRLQTPYDEWLEAPYYGEDEDAEREERDPDRERDERRDAERER